MNCIAKNSCSVSFEGSDFIFRNKEMAITVTVNTKTGIIKALVRRVLLKFSFISQRRTRMAIVSGIYLATKRTKNCEKNWGSTLKFMPRLILVILKKLLIFNRELPPYTEDLWAGVLHKLLLGTLKFFPTYKTSYKTHLTSNTYKISYK